VKLGSEGKRSGIIAAYQLLGFQTLYSAAKRNIRKLRQELKGRPAEESIRDILLEHRHRPSTRHEGDVLTLVSRIVLVSSSVFVFLTGMGATLIPCLPFLIPVDLHFFQRWIFYQYALLLECRSARWF